MSKEPARKVVSCQDCGKEFMRKRSDNKYCPDCGKIRGTLSKRNKSLAYTCEVCGKEFHPWRPRTQANLYCSWDCRFESQREGQSPLPKVTYCKECGVELRRGEGVWYINRGYPPTFCEEHRPKQKRTPNCAVCGKEKENKTYRRCRQCILDERYEDE